MNLDSINQDCLGHISQFLNPFYGICFYPLISINLIKKIKEDDTLIPSEFINLKFLNFLIRSNIKLSLKNKKHITKYFVETENYEGLEWCLFNDFPNTSYTAAECGNLNILKWCVSHGVLLDFYTSFVAGKYNNLHVLQWMVKNLNDYNAMSCINIYNQGLYSILEWGNQNRINSLEIL